MRELAKEVICVFFLLKLELTASTLRYTNLDVPIRYGGYVYTPIGMEIQGFNYSSALSVDQLTLVLDNTNLALSAYVLGEDVRNKWGTLSIAVMLRDSGEWEAGTEWEFDTEWVVEGTRFLANSVFKGLIGEWNLTEQSLEAKLVNELVLWNKKPLRTCSQTCPWTFKGTECAYVGGETWCDQSYERCVQLGNDLGTGGVGGYGGFRFILAMEEKIVWWGKTPS